MSRGRPVLIRRRASRPARAQYVLPPLMGFCSPSAFRIARSARASLDERAGYPVPADSVFAVSTTLTSSSTRDLADSLTRIRSTLGVLCAIDVAFDGKRIGLRQPPLLPPRVARCDLGARIASSRALATNAVPFAQASPTSRIPNRPTRSRFTPLQGLNPCRARRTHVRLLPRASPPSLPLTPASINPSSARQQKTQRCTSEYSRSDRLALTGLPS